MTDPISDMLTRIRNAQMAKSLKVNIPHSMYKENILKVIQEEGYIKSYKVNQLSDAIKEITVDLKFSDEGVPAITEIKKVSKPGRRVFSSVEDLKPIFNGLGVYIVSTSKGVLTDNQARKENVGGEVICYIF